jgi:hypothetical protein
MEPVRTRRLASLQQEGRRRMDGHAVVHVLGGADDAKGVEEDTAARKKGKKDVSFVLLVNSPSIRTTYLAKKISEAVNPIAP